MMRNTRVRFGPPPRKFGMREQISLRIAPPSWCTSNDELRVIYKDQRVVFSEGYVVWSHLVQANSDLFSSSSSENCPAAVVYSPQLHWGDQLFPLADMAQQVFELREAVGGGAREQQLGRLLADEYARFFDEELPRSIAGDAHVLLTSIMVHRKHLPDSHLVSSYLPLVVHPRTPASLILPGKFWDLDLVEAWKE
ncbi:MAG: hypothetical protein AAGF97_14510 [Planctomycetota bacterium]